MSGNGNSPHIETPTPNGGDGRYDRLLSFEYDQFQRYWLLRRALRAAFAPTGRPGDSISRPRAAVKVLEVGSGPQRMAEEFLGEGFSVTRADVDDFGRSDIIRLTPGKPIPAEDGAFDAVACLEVLEHVPPTQRAGLVAECLRVARRVAVITCPVGDPAVAAAERRISAAFEAVNARPHPFLCEHFEHGPPAPAEVAGILDRLGRPYVAVETSRLDCWEAYLMLGQLLHTVPGGLEVLPDLHRRMNRRTAGRPEGARHYRQAYLVAVDPAALPALRDSAPEAGAETAGAPGSPAAGPSASRGNDHPDPLFQLAALAAETMSDRLAGLNRLASVPGLFEECYASLFPTGAPPVVPPARPPFWKFWKRTPRRLPLVADSNPSVVSAKVNGREIRALCRPTEPASFRVPMPADAYTLRGRALSLEPTDLILSVGTHTIRLASLGPAVQSFSVDFDLSRGAEGFRLSLTNPSATALIADLEAVRMPDPGGWRTAAKGLFRRIKGSSPVQAFLKTAPGRKVRRLLRGPDDADIAAADSAAHAAWMQARIAARRTLYPGTAEPGLLSLLTTVYDTPVKYLDILVRSLREQQPGAGPDGSPAASPAFEWVILDNGSSRPETVEYLKKLAAEMPNVKLARVEGNLGIIGGMRHCLERAAGRYVLPMDSDDYLYPDALRVVAHHLRAAGFPPLLYTDEDLLLEDRPHSPFHKPDWDPVLFLNSCYIAHLCAIDRRLAMGLGCYADPQSSGCHDWDTFTRFLVAGHVPVHAPEIVYSWRMHPDSCSMNPDSKPYVWNSQRHVLENYLATRKPAGRYRVDRNPLVTEAPNWWFRRERTDPRPLLTVIAARDPRRVDLARLPDATGYPGHRCAAIPLDGGLAELHRLVAREASRPGSGSIGGGLIHLVYEDVVMTGDEWPWELLTLFELHPDTAVIGGRVLDGADRVVAAGEYLGFGGDCGCPDLRRPSGDPGYFSWMRKQRSVGAASSLLMAADAAFLAEFLTHMAAPGRPAMSLPFLGAWLGAFARREGRRVVFSPHFSGRCGPDPAWPLRVPPEERSAFRAANADVLDDVRHLPRHLSRDPARPYRAV